MKKIPSGIHTVPTLIIHGINKPLVGKETFIWLNNWINMKSQKNTKTSESSIRGFSQQEMTGFSDQFAYLSVDSAQAKSFFVYGDEENNRIITGEEYQQKIDGDQMRSSMRELNYSRNQEDKEIEMTLRQMQK